MEALRINLLLPLYHEFIQAKYFEELQCRFANVVLALKPEAGKVYGRNSHFILNQFI